MRGGGRRLAAFTVVAFCLTTPPHAANLVAAAVDPVTATYQIANSLDDVTQVNSTLDEFGANLWVGTGGSATASYTGLRFRLDIPRGSTITSARLEVNAAQTQWVAIGVETGIEAGPSAAPFSRQALPSTRVLAPGRVPHNSNVQWAQFTWYSLGEMGSLLQQAVDHADWTPTSSAAFVVRGTSGTWGRKFVYGLDANPLRAPRLVVTYTPAAVSPPPPPPPPPGSGFTNNKMLVGFDAPTSITVVPDGRLLVTERAGRVRVVLPGRTNYEPVPFLQLTNIEALVGERALVSLALDPDFATNSRYYVFYTRQSPLLDTVSRFTAVGNTTDPATEVVIYQDDRPSSDIHHGGGMGFGPDGRLYISTGDGHDTQPGSAHAAQQLTTYRGKVLRINRDGTIPSDNPFNDGPGPNLDAIWALGFRNPFRLSVDAATGALHVYDVGGGAWEEVNLITRGANYGWPICEGECTAPGTTNPLFTYPHPNRDTAIGGGVVYRGTAFPASHRGNLFYGDFAQAWIRRLVFAGDGSVASNLPFDPPDGASDGPTGAVVDIDVGVDGALYYVNIGGGSVHRISYYSGNRPPVVLAATGTPITGTTAPLPVQFAVEADDADGQPLTYRWEFGDGSTSSERDPLHLYGTTGTFMARVLVSDGTATTFSEPIEVRIGTPPIVSITVPADGATFRAGDEIAFAGTAHDDEILTAAAFAWTVVFHHDGHTHPGFGPFSGITSGSFVVPTFGHDFSGNTSYELALTVRDGQGLESTVSHTLRPQKANLTLASDPPGLQLSLDASTRPAPFVQDTLVGFTHRVTAPTSQQLGGVTYDFTGWSDGGAPAHDITAPASATTLVATYRPPPALRVADVAVVEGNSGSTALTFTVTLTAASVQPVAVTATTANGTATAGLDYAATTGVLVFAPGVTTQSFAVSVLGDAVAEPDETMMVNLTAATNATIADAQGVGTIANDDALPAGPVTVTIPLVGLTDDVNEAGTDYQAAASAVWLGNGGTATTSYTGLRFTGLDVPRGATIVSARLEVNAAQTQWIALQYQVGIEDAGNSPPFSSNARPSTRLLALPRLAHTSNVQWVTGSWYTVDGLGPLVQAVTARADWTRLNSLALVLRGTGPTWGRKFARSRDAGAATAPRLVVVFNPPPP